MFVQNLLAIVFASVSFLALGQSTKKDTAFLLKENRNGIYHSIFIDYNKNSEFYRQVSDFNPSAVGGESNAVFLKPDRGGDNKTKKFVKGVLPSKWIIIRQYQGKYYAYKPSDLYNNTKIEVMDKMVIHFTGEGPVVNKVLAFKEINDKTFRLELTDPNKTYKTLTIHLLNKKKGIAVFEERSLGQNPKYFLMVSADNINELPIIVNYCETQKQLEFKFDDPDYKKIIECEPIKPVHKNIKPNKLQLLIPNNNIL